MSSISNTQSSSRLLPNNDAIQHQAQTHQGSWKKTSIGKISFNTGMKWAEHQLDFFYQILKNNFNPSEELDSWRRMSTETLYSIMDYEKTKGALATFCNQPQINGDPDKINVTMYANRLGQALYEMDSCFYQITAMYINLSKVQLGMNALPADFKEMKKCVENVQQNSFAIYKTFSPENSELCQKLEALLQNFKTIFDEALSQSLDDEMKESSPHKNLQGLGKTLIDLYREIKAFGNKTLKQNRGNFCQKLSEFSTSSNEEDAKKKLDELDSSLKGNFIFNAPHEDAFHMEINIPKKGSQKKSERWVFNLHLNEGNKIPNGEINKDKIASLFKDTITNNFKNMLKYKEIPNLNNLNRNNRHSEADEKGGPNDWVEVVSNKSKRKGQNKQGG